jgi:hypothetical protein
VQGRLLLNVIVCDGAAVLEALACEDEALLVGGDALLVLDLGFNLLDGVCRLYVDGDRAASECLDEYLHVAFLVGY